eukprot:1849876-Rhodomonas_salina.1
MAKVRHCDIIQRVSLLKLGHFNRELSREWAQPKTFRLEDNDEGSKALKEIHAIAQGKQFRVMNQNFVLMLQKAWLKAKGNNRQQEHLAGILLSHCVQDLLDGTLDVSGWETSPWLWVSVEVFCRILLLYEGMAEAVDGNDTTVLSVHEADQNMECLLLPLKQNFTTLGDFLNYMRACVQAAIIARTQSKGRPGGRRRTTSSSSCARKPQLSLSTWFSRWSSSLKTILLALNLLASWAARI